MYGVIHGMQGWQKLGKYTYEQTLGIAKVRQIYL